MLDQTHQHRNSLLAVSFFDSVLHTRVYTKMASNLPPGWGDRNNTMSEHEMTFGGKKNGAYGDGTEATSYKSSDDVKAFYMKQIDMKTTNTNESLLQVEELAKAAPPVPAMASSNKPEVALVQVATHTLYALAATLEGQTVSLPMEERAAFAVAMKRAMDALVKCS
jgi:hypothetical protein